MWVEEAAVEELVVVAVGEVVEEEAEEAMVVVNLWVTSVALSS